MLQARIRLKGSEGSFDNRDRTGSMIGRNMLVG